MIDISQRVYLEGVGLDQLTYDLWPLVVIAIITLTASSLTLRLRVA
jgi:hypothetical protein